jgi:hypothetical protein
MRWSVVPFGKYKGKTFPEIIVRDPDWFFWVLPNLYGNLADEAKVWRRKHEQLKSRNQIDASGRSNINTIAIKGFAALRSSKRMRGIRNGPLGFHTSICGGLFAGNTTSELAVS